MPTKGQGFPGGASGEELACQCRRHRFDPWKIPWRRKRQPTPVFLPGKFHGQRSMAGYSPWGCRELDMTEQLSTHTGAIWIIHLVTGLPCQLGYIANSFHYLNELNLQPKALTKIYLKHFIKNHTGNIVLELRFQIFQPFEVYQTTQRAFQ